MSPAQMRLALCKSAHFMFPQIFSECQRVDSAQQAASLGAVGIAEPEQWDSLNTLSDETLPKPCSLSTSLSLRLLLSHSVLHLNAPLKVKGSLVLSMEEQMKVERHFFPLFLSQ